ncbi:MAG: bifunctional folylpolyglutamate synthase/dihydrofolate synthase [Deltaproteobacteria bacterium]|nr:bifunctional folylpolyglutamate synthase/dihydrofolate synthase [Deltaproteobacteria bacterium]RLB29392.1 MAG: bifunctional folylpolyglutamate synthase/dihydrofolate synthase [Deltaproteobacteria bacterium]
MVSQAKGADGRGSSYEEALSRLYSLQKYGIKFGLSKTSNLLRAFKDPHLGQRYIHIAGTNGKGSVGAMLEAILLKSGLTVGLYTSPHLVSFTERFRINKVCIERDQAAALMNEIDAAVDKREPPTFFEMATAMALIYFARNNVDIGIIEAGMGGRLDATNVITPMVSVITNIGLEHRQFLGNTITDIAREKGGIIKTGIDVVTAVNQTPVKRLIQALCDERGAPCWRIGRDARYQRLPSGHLGYYGLRDSYPKLALGLKGRFQYRNAALCLLALEILKRKGIAASEDDIRLGLADPLWPGRLEIVSARPMIVLDGAHNIAAMRSLADSIKRDFDFKDLVLVVGIMADKEISPILREVLPLASKTIFTRPAYYRASEPQLLLQAAEKLGSTGEVRVPLSAAIERARNLAGERDLILITGSLFTVGEAKSCLDPTRYPREHG